jgi:hypothetical protein
MIEVDGQVLPVSQAGPASQKTPMLDKKDGSAHIFL